MGSSQSEYKIMEKIARPAAVSAPRKHLNRFSYSTENQANPKTKIAP
jgi:hypothetical protein